MALKFYRKRPCRICGKWFRPDRRKGDEQKVCGDKACQRERHRRNCVDWHKRNRNYDKLTQFQQHIERDPPQANASLADINWDYAAEQVDPLVAMLLEVVSHKVCAQLRDELLQKPLKRTVTSRPNPGGNGRDELFELASVNTGTCQPNPRKVQRDEMGLRDMPP